MSPDWLPLIGQGGSTAAITVGLWFLHQGIKENRERSEERHVENQIIMKETQEDVRRINGTLARHGERLGDHEREIRRLRDRK